MRKAIVHKTFVFWATSFLFITLFVFDTTAQEKDKIHIGAAISITGKFAREGGLSKIGYDFWRDWANERGGINVGGKKYLVDIIYYDDKSDAMTSAKLTEKLITEDKVNFLLSPYSSGIVFATSAIGERYGYITIAGAANSDGIYERGYKNIFSVMPPASWDFYYILDVLMQQKPTPKKIAILSLDNLYPILATDGLRRQIKTLGLEEVYYTKFPVKTNDFSGMLTILKGKNPDLLFFGGFFEDSIAFMKQCKEINVNPKAYAFLSAPEFEDWVKILGKDGDYVFSASHWTRGMRWKGPYFDSETFADTFQKKFGPPSFLHAVAATSGLLLQIAVEKAGTLDQAKIRDVLRNMEITTFYGPFKWDEQGKNVKGRLGSIQIQNQRIVSLDPPDPGAKIVYPHPPWSKR